MNSDNSHENYTLLKRWGWNHWFEETTPANTRKDLRPGRIIKVSRHLFTITFGDLTLQGEISGSFRYKTVFASDFPVIGDWVLCRGVDSGTCIIEEVLPRKTRFSRKAAGNVYEEQVLAANIDIIGLVFGLNGGRNFTPGALERYVILAWESGSEPIILLNKADLATEEVQEHAVLLAEAIAPFVPVFLVSAETGAGLKAVGKACKPGKTMALVGPSGVGKSTLINALAGAEIQKTGAQREHDQTGRHTTTHRELFMLSSGGMLIDSPGLREIQLWAGEESASETFLDIEEFAANCRFSDCSHQGEPGCAVQAALSTGELDYRRYENYLDVMKEIRYLKTKQDPDAAREEKAKWKKIGKLVKEIKNNSEIY